MSIQETTQPVPTGGDQLRQRLLSGLPVTERRLSVAGIDTAVLDGGSGPPVVLLHDPAEYAAKWASVIPQLVATHRVIAPDLPGHGATEPLTGPVDRRRIIDWLDELVTQTCQGPPAMVGLILGGAIAARFTIDRPTQVSRLVLVDSLGLAALAPTPAFGQALTAYLAAPSEETHEQLWQQCAFDLDRLRDRMGARWEAFTAYNLDRAAAPGAGNTLGALMEQFGMPAIAPEDLATIDTPTTLIWGRHDQATSVSVAQAASARYGWPLHVIEDCADDPVLERPEEFLRALHVALGRTVTGRRP